VEGAERCASLSPPRGLGALTVSASVHADPVDVTPAALQRVHRTASLSDVNSNSAMPMESTSPGPADAEVDIEVS
jgi:hypothetical protein